MSGIEPMPTSEDPELHHLDMELRKHEEMMEEMIKELVYFNGDIHDPGGGYIVGGANFVSFGSLARKSA